MSKVTKEVVDAYELSGVEMGGDAKPVVRDRRTSAYDQAAKDAPPALTRMAAIGDDGGPIANTVAMGEPTVKEPPHPGAIAVGDAPLTTPSHPGDGASDPSASTPE